VFGDSQIGHLEVLGVLPPEVPNPLYILVLWHCAVATHCVCYQATTTAIPWCTTCNRLLEGSKVLLQGMYTPLGPIYGMYP